MKFLSDLKQKDFSEEIVLLRVDLNIDPAQAEYSPRISDIVPTISFLIDRHARVVILSHRGRPGGKGNKELSLAPYKRILADRVDADIEFIEHFNFEEIANTVKASSPGSVFLMENMRFLEGEKQDDDELAKKLASLGTLYINDAFGVSHRANASVHAIAGHLPSCAGFLLEAEVKNLSRAMEHPESPLIVIVGGVKVSGKIALVEEFFDKAEVFLIGGAMANTFLKSLGKDIGDSMYEEDKLALAKELYERGKIVLPDDSIRKDNEIFDIGEQTREKFKSYINKAATIIWNGPLGYIEDEVYAKGTASIIHAIADSDAFSVVGGGETVQLIERMNMRDAFSFVSTGGGAMLAFLSGESLPGIAALEE